MNTEFIEERINKNTLVRITAVNKKVNFSDNVYAVNWFNTNLSFLYNLYNVLAAKSLYKVGGRLIFKGKITKSLFNNTFLKREVLLIVKYPSISSFISLLKSTYFQIISGIRIWAVKEFSFCFTAPVTTNKGRSEVYMIHVFKHKNATAILAQANTIKGSNVSLFYAGVTSSSLSVKKTESNTKIIPYVLDGILLFGAASAHELETLFFKTEYQQLLKNTTATYVGLMNSAT